ncbi:MAG: AbgT family transporter [Planctomycetia bacterium]
MQSMHAPSEGKGFVDRFLRVVERGGNALPHPATLFLLLALLVVLASEVAVQMGVSATHPKTGEELRPTSLFGVEGLHLVLTKTVTNFTGFAPLGTVLVALLGIGIAESSGLIGAALRLVVLSAARRWLALVVVFAGVMSNVASELGYVLLVPLAGSIFAAAGRHPIAGMAAAFAGVSGGYSANLLLGTVDPLLAGITQEAARIVEPGALVNPACNYYFMAASTFVISLTGWWLTERVVEPRLGAWSGASGAEAADLLKPLSAVEKRGLAWALATVAAIAALVLWGLLPEGGFLRDPKTDGVLHSPFMSGIVTLIFFIGAASGIAYGVATRSIRSDGQAMKGMAKSMETLASYLVLVFFAAQFVAYFTWTNLGLIMAVKGAALLQSSGLGGGPALVAFIFLTALVNLVMGSASAKWALMAPVFVPMFLLAGIPADATQCAFRIGDSCTNVISPMMSYFALIIAFLQRHDPKAGLGTLVATMFPYSFAFLVVWTLMFVAWHALGLPFGPG